MAFPLSKEVQYRRARSLTMSPPAVPLTAVTLVLFEDGTVGEYPRPVLAVVGVVYDCYFRPRRGEYDSGVPANPPCPRSLREEGYRPRFADAGPEFDYLIDGEYGPGLLRETYSDSVNSLTVVVPAAEMPLKSEIKDDALRTIRSRLPRRPADGEDLTAHPADDVLDALSDPRR